MRPMRSKRRRTTETLAGGERLAEALGVALVDFGGEGDGAEALGGSFLGDEGGDHAAQFRGKHGA
jgi:hypothetical protein